MFSISSDTFNESVDDRVAALATEGNGISISYDDSADTLTFSTVFASNAESIAGTVSNKSVPPSGLSAMRTHDLQRNTYTGYSKTTNATPSAGRYYITNGTITLQPKNATDRSSLTTHLQVGQRFEIYQDNGLLSGWISAVSGGDSNNPFSISLRTPYSGDADSITAGTIYVEGEIAYESRLLYQSSGGIRARQLDVSGNGTNGQFLISDGDGSFSWNSPSSDALTEGSTNLFFTDARARSALSVADSAIIDYASSTGQFSTDTASLATAMKGILGSGGTNVTITQTNNSITISSTGGSGGSSTLLGLNDVSGTNITAGEVLIATSSTAFGIGKISAASISDNVVGADALNVSGDGTSGQLLASDGSGGFTWASASSIGISSFTALTSLDASTRGFLVYSGTSIGRLPLAEMNYYVEPVHLLDLTLSGYSMITSGNPTTQGQVRIVEASGRTFIYMNPKIDSNRNDTQALLTILTEEFKIRVFNGDNSKMIEGTIDQQSKVPGSTIIIGRFAEDTLETTGTFSSSESVSFRSFGRHPSFADIVQTIVNGSKYEYPSTEALIAYVIEYFKENLPSYEPVASLTNFLLTGSADIEASEDIKLTSATNTWRARMTSTDWGRVEPLWRTGTQYTMIDADNNTTVETGTITGVDLDIANVGSDRVVEFTRSRSTGSLTDTSEVDSLDINFKAAHADALEEWVEDIVNGMVVAGSGITKTYNDSANTMTLALDFASVDEARVATNTVKAMSPDRTDDFFQSRKATGDDLSDDNDTHWLSPLGFNHMLGSAANGVSRTFTWDSDGGQLGVNLTAGEIALEPSQTFQYNIKVTNANRDAIDRELRPNVKVRLQTDASNYVEGYIQWGALDRSTNVQAFKIKSTGRNSAGSLSGTITLTSIGALREDLENAQVIFYDSIVAGENITLSNWDATNQQFTITATGGAGGTPADGSITTAKLANDAVDETKMDGLGTGSLGNFVVSDGSGGFTYDTTIDGAQITNDAITGAKIADDAVDIEHLNAGSATSGYVLTAGSGGNSFVWAQAASGGGASVDLQQTAPSSPSTGDLWVDTDTGKLYTRYDSTWMNIGGGGGGGASWTYESSKSFNSTIKGMEWTDVDDDSPTILKIFLYDWKDASDESAGNTPVFVQLGVGGSYISTGYIYGGARSTSTNTFAYSNKTGSNFQCTWGVSGIKVGTVTLTNVAGNTWLMESSFSAINGSGDTGMHYANGYITLSGALDRLKIYDTSTGNSQRVDTGTAVLAWQ